jgi:hypothetical protein
VISPHDCCRRNSVTSACFLFVLLTCFPVLAQNPQVAANLKPAFPMVTFSWARWGATPSQYSLSIASDGNATYESRPRSVRQTGVPYTVEFVVSGPTRQMIFDLAQKLKFLNLRSPEERFSGEKASVKTISFRDGGTHHEIIFYRTDNPQVRTLAATFESIARTLQFGRRLSDLHQQHSGRLGNELTQMQQSLEGKHLSELQAVANVLQSITSDASLAPSVRNQAQAILDRS